MEVQEVMSLLDNAMETYIMLNKISSDDGYGGKTTSWQEGARIQGAMVFDSSISARVADAQGVTSVYTLTTRRNITLEFHDVLRRVRDGKIFRVTSDGDDLYTPASAGLDMRQVTCEEWTLPREE